MANLESRVSTLEKQLGREDIKMPDKLKKYFTGDHLLASDEADKLFKEWMVKVVKAVERGSDDADELFRTFMSELPRDHQNYFIALLKAEKEKLESR